MTIYFDPSVLVALYVYESRTASLREWMTQRQAPIGINVWQEIEFRTAARQKVLRREIAEGDLARALRVFDDDCIRGKVLRRSISWDAAFARAERVSNKFAISTPCRSFDLLHVAIAQISDIPEFATFDEQQRKLAELVGLNAISLPV